MSDIVRMLRVSESDPVQQEAADEIERLRAELAALCARKPIVYSPDAEAMSDRVKAAEAERDALRSLLREAREYTGYAAHYGDSIEADHAGDLCARIDATLSKGGGDE